MSLPIITAGQSFSGKVGVFFTATTPAFDGSEQVTSWSATGLPAGLGQNPSTGAISGFPTAKGSFTASFTATNISGTSAPTSIAFSIADGVPVITAGQSALGLAGTAFSKIFSLTDSANRPVTSWEALSHVIEGDMSFLGLPSWATLNPTTGAITGTPQDSGDIILTLRATGPGGTDTKEVTISIVATPPIFTPPIFTGDIQATSIYAGATAAKAIYYGAKKLWPPLKYHEILESLATINPADGSRGHSKFLDTGLNLAVSNLSRIGFKFASAVRIKNATITTSSGAYTLGVATNWNLVRYFSSHDLTITPDGIGRSGSGNIGGGWVADVCGFWVDIPASSLTSELSVDYEYIGAYAAKHGVAFWNSTTTAGGDVESFIGTWDNTPRCQMPTNAELPRIIVTAQSSLISNTLLRRRVIIQNNP
jgi:hypothetical protein